MIPNYQMKNFNIWGQFHQHFCPTFSREQVEKLFLQLAFGKVQTDLANRALLWQISPQLRGKFQSRMFVKLNGNFFYQMLRANDSSLATQSLVKSTPGVNFINILHTCSFCTCRAQKHKKDSQVISLFTQKLCVNMLVKSTPGF